MPDQSSASTEHALMQEITAPLATLPDDPVTVVAVHDFPIVLRGYERDAVDSYVQRTSQLVAELQATRSPDAAVRRALERVGEEVSGILQRAHDTGAQITAQSRSEAEDRLEKARQEAAQIIARAEERVRELDAETDRIWAERRRIVEDIDELARELLTLTASAAERFPADQAVAGAEAGADPASAAAGPGAAAAGPGWAAADPGAVDLPEGDPRVEPAPVEIPAEDALPDEVPVGEHDPHVEPTAILPVVEPPEYDPGRAPDRAGDPKRRGDDPEGAADDPKGAGDDSEGAGDDSERPDGPKGLWHDPEAK